MSTDAFSVDQCVVKRSRQLDRLLYMIESTAAKFYEVKSSTNVAAKTRTQVQKQYGMLLLEFLTKEQALGLPALFADALHLERHEDELQQLLMLVEEEEMLRQRIGMTWEFLVITSVDQDNVVLVRSCETTWNKLMPMMSCTLPTITAIRAALGHPERNSASHTEAKTNAVHPWSSALERSSMI